MVAVTLLPEKAACPECGFEGTVGGLTLYPVWEDAENHRTEPPDYLGCKHCSTLSDWEDV